MARLLRFHGSPDQVNWEYIGYNSRLDELQAAFLRVLLTQLDRWAAARAEAGVRYERAGLGEVVKPPRPTEGSRAAWHLYVIRSDDVDQIASRLTQAGIGNKIYYRRPLHQHRAMREYAQGVRLPAT